MMAFTSSEFMSTLPNRRDFFLGGDWEDDLEEVEEDEDEVLGEDLRSSDDDWSANLNVNVSKLLSYHYQYYH